MQVNLITTHDEFKYRKKGKVHPIRGHEDPRRE
jgi:hypothetical protein